MLFLYTTVILPGSQTGVTFFKMCIVSNSHSFRTLPPKAFRAPFSLKYRPPKKTLFPGKLPLRGIIKILVLDSFRLSIYTTVNLPGRITVVYNWRCFFSILPVSYQVGKPALLFFKMCIVSNSHSFKTLDPKAFRAPFSLNNMPPKKTLFPGKLSLRGIMKIVV